MARAVISVQAQHLRAKGLQALTSAGTRVCREEFSNRLTRLVRRLGRETSDSYQGRCPTQPSRAPVLPQCGREHPLPLGSAVTVPQAHSSPRLQQELQMLRTWISASQNLIVNV